MHRSKPALALMLSIMIIFFSAFRTDAYSYLNYSSLNADRTNLYTTSDKVWLLSYKNSELYLEQLSPDSFYITVPLSYPVTCAALFGDTVVALCNDVSNASAIVYYYDISSDVLDSAPVRSLTAYDDSLIAYDSDCFYILDANGRTVNRYSHTGKFEYYYSFVGTVTDIFCDGSHHIYAISDNRLFRLEPSAITSIAGPNVIQSGTFISNDLFYDATGSVFRISSAGIEKIISVQNASYAGVIGEYIYIASRNTVWRYTLSGVKDAQCNLSADIFALVCCNDEVIAATNESGIRINFLSEHDFVLLDSGQTIPNTPNEGNADSPDAQSSGTDSSVQNQSADTISSQLYDIDFERYYIRNIPAGTTLAQLKKNIFYDGYTVSFYRDGALQKSGKAATAMTAVFSGRNTYTFELSVTGDLTGEGGVNTKDLYALMDYLLDEWMFTGVYLDTADLNRDGVIDLVDTMYLCRMVVK